MTVQELYDKLGELILDGRSSLPIMTGPCNGRYDEPNTVEFHSENIGGPFVAIVQSELMGEEGDPLEEAVENATTFRPDV